MKKYFMAGALGLSALIVAGCGEPNYRGEGNEFLIRAQVVEKGDQSLKVDTGEIIVAEGKARNRFTAEGNSVNRIHNNFENEWCNEDHVGEEYDREGNVIDIADIEIGQWVEIEGEIRESKTSCGKNPSWDYRPVYETVREISR